MTRKCVLCKETNYKNNYSFFSAPKDPEIRKKWRDAIAIKDYIVNDDTYVCSRHFDKKDIITHWVSGIPPHVITIKYKKCRLRPGAVPSRKYFNDMDNEIENDCSVLCSGKGNVYPNSRKDQDRLSSKEENENFLIPREDKIDNNTDIDTYKILDEFEIKDEENEHMNMIHFRKDTTSFTSLDSYRLDDSEEGMDIEEGIEDIEETKYTETEIDCDTITKDETKYCRTIPDQQCEDNDDYSLHEYANNGMSGNLYKKTEISDDISGNEFLFEDLLEVCTDVVLPRGWSCLVTSKGHATTIVYLYLEMTRKGMPFIEKQVYLKSDMIMHCSVADREINPIIHNLVREGKHLKVQSLMDIEELIDEFNQRTICEGLTSSENVQEINDQCKVAYKDIKWRHVLCPLIINNDSMKCSKCTTLSNVIARKSKESFSVPYDASIFLKKRLKAKITQKLLQAKKRKKSRNKIRESL